MSCRIFFLVFVTEQRETSHFSFFFVSFVPKTAALPPPLFLLFVQLVFTLTGLRVQRHSVAQDAQLGTVKGAMVRGDKGGCMVGRALCVIECLLGCVPFSPHPPYFTALFIV
jgi:hypothetical protein